MIGNNRDVFGSLNLNSVLEKKTKVVLQIKMFFYDR